MIELAYIIPAFNAADTIGDTLGSVLAQRGPHVHAIVVDDGSTDGTGDIARAHRDWRVEVVRQRNQGLAGARNTGLEALEDRAGAVCFLDADDTVEQGHAEALVAGLQHPARGRLVTPHASDLQIDLVACAYRMVGPRLQDLGWTIDVADADWRYERLIEFNPFAVGGVALRVDSLRRIAGDRPFDESLGVHEDWALWLRLLAAGASLGGVVHEQLFNYRMRAGSLSRAVGRMWREGNRVIASAPLPDEVEAGDVAPRSLIDLKTHARALAARRWTIRHLARAAVAAPNLVPDLLTELDARGGRTLDPADRAAFLGSLRHAFLLEYALGPAGGSAREEQWRDHARTALHTWPESHTAIDALTFTSWEAVAARLARLLGRVGGRGRLAHLRPVVVGMGRNGRALATALASRAIAFDWADDDAAAACPVRAGRIATSQIAPRHLVIATPTEHADLLERLRQSRALVMTPAELVAGGHEATSDSLPGETFSGRRVA